MQLAWESRSATSIKSLLAFFAFSYCGGFFRFRCCGNSLAPGWASTACASCQIYHEGNLPSSGVDAHVLVVERAGSCGWRSFLNHLFSHHWGLFHVYIYGTCPADLVKIMSNLSLGAIQTPLEHQGQEPHYETLAIQHTSTSIRTISDVWRFSGGIPQSALNPSFKVWRRDAVNVFCLEIWWWHLSPGSHCTCPPAIKSIKAQDLLGGHQIFCFLSKPTTFFGLKLLPMTRILLYLTQCDKTFFHQGGKAHILKVAWVRTFELIASLVLLFIQRQHLFSPVYAASSDSFMMILVHLCKVPVKNIVDHQNYTVVLRHFSQITVCGSLMAPFVMWPILAHSTNIRVTPSRWVLIRLSYDKSVSPST